MPISIFKEKKTLGSPGITPFTTSYCTDNPQEEIDAIFFPYLVSENFLTLDIQRILLSVVKGKHPKHVLADDALTFDYMNAEVPKYLCDLYREQLQKKYPRLEKKPIVFFHNTDYAEPYDIDSDVIVIRSSINRSTMGISDIVRPAGISYEDWKGPIREKKITIGFCGFPLSHSDRIKSIDILEKLDTNQFDRFYTQRFYHHYDKVVKEQYPEFSAEKKKRALLLVKEELQNTFHEILHRNIFSFCPRGRGNYSIRFYETLRAGRIPVMVDSDQVFPCEDLIDWNDIVICAKDTEEMIKMVHDWTEHRDLIAIQKRCREVWEQFLQSESFLNLLPKYIEQRIS